MDVEDKLRDVFGDSDEEGGNKSDSREQSGKKEGSGGEDQAAKDLEDDVPQTRDGGDPGPSGDAAPEPQRQRERITIRAPLLDGIPPNNLFCAKATNQFDVFCKPYQADEDVGDMEYVDNTGRHRVKMSHYSGIRWRWVQDANGNVVPESNARLVTWSDGSRHLIVGDEYYEVRQHNTGREAPFLYAALGKGVHQSIGHMRQLLKFSLPPGSKASRILLSRAAKAALKSRIDLRAASQRVATEARDRVAIDAERAALAEKRRRQELQRAQRERAAAGGSSRHHRNAGLTAEFLEEADDDDFVAHEHGDAELARVDRDDVDEADALERIRAAKRARVEVEEQHKRHRGQVLLSDEED